jgi:ATP-dependent DNA helicase 2 subunit 2
MSSNKEALCVILDMASNSLDSFQHCVMQMLHQKILDAKKTDLFSLIYLSSNKTNNHLKYEGIETKFLFQQASLEMLQDVSSLCKSKTDSGDPFDALVVGADLLIEKCKGKKFDKRLYLFAESLPSGTEQSYLDQLKIKFQGEEIIVYIILSNNNVQNEKSLSEWATILSLEEVQDLLNSKVAMKRTRQTAVFKGSLYLGKLEMFVKAFTKTQTAPLPRFSRLAFAERSVSYHKKVNGEDQTEEEKAEETFVEKDSLLKAFRYGKSLVPFNKVDMSAVALETSKGLSILGFGKLADFNVLNVLGNCLYITFDDDAEESSKILFSALVRAMYEKEVVALSRYVLAETQPPKLLALLPKVRKGGREGFLALQLPFSDDFRRFSFPKLPFRISQKQETTMKEFVDWLSRDEYDYQNTNNPITARILAAIQSRAIHDSSELPAINVQHLSMLNPNIDVNNDHYKKLQEIFPLKSAEKWQALIGPDQILPRFWAKDQSKGEDKIPESGDGEFNLEVYWKWMNDRMQDRVAEAMIKMMSFIPKILANEKDSEDDCLKKAVECLKSLREGAVREEEHIRYNAYVNEVKKRRISNEDPQLNKLWFRMKEDNLGVISNAECENSIVSPDEAYQFFFD